MHDPSSGFSLTESRSDRFDQWRGDLDSGITGIGCRLFIRGRYKLESRCGGKKLEVRRTDFNPTLVTIDIVDTAGDGGEWIDLEGDFEVPGTVEQAILVDGDQTHIVPIDRSRMPAPGADQGSDTQSASLGEEGKESSIPCPFAGNRNWNAWVNAMPGSTRTLIVTGEVKVGTDGYAGRLTPGGVEKSDPPNQIFELTLVEEADAKAGWQEDVRADMPATYPKYGTAVIMCHGERLADIVVEIVE